MHRFLGMFLALAAAGVVFASAAAADTEGLHEQVRQLQEKIDALESRASTTLEQEIEEYLGRNQAVQSAQGGGLEGVTIRASLTAVNQNTVGFDPFNRSTVNGDVDLGFDFQLTDNLTMFATLTANDEGEGTLNAHLPTDGPPGFPGGLTLSGVMDGIGVNGTTPTDPGSVTLYEAGIQHSFDLGSGGTRLNWAIGALDPRRRFAQNAFADDENTQFINNLFDDPPTILWLTNASGTTSYGFHTWISFGAEQQFTLSAGYFNTPGRWFEHGQLFLQLHYTGQIDGREMNLRVYFEYDELFGDDNLAFGASWDWLVTDQIGLFVRGTFGDSDINPIEWDISGGLQFAGLIPDRADDKLGVAIGAIGVNDDNVTLPEDLELTVEVYYNYQVEGGKLQISPHIMWVMDPLGGVGEDDTLFIVGVRIHVPF